MVGDQIRQADLRRFVRGFGAEIATDRQVALEKVYCPAGWLTAMAHSQGTDIGPWL